MYSLNGVALKNPTFGWRLQAPSRPAAMISKRTLSLASPGVDGVYPVPSDFDAPTIMLAVLTPQSGLAALMALVSAPLLTLTLTSDPTRSVAVELLSTTYDQLRSADQSVIVRFMLRFDGAFWRDTTATISTPVALSSASVAAAVFAGLSAPIRDAGVRVKGPVTNVRVTDAGGSWWTFPGSIVAGKSVIFTNGFAVLSSFADSDWDDFDSDVSGQVDFGGPRSAFEITPSFTDPSSRQAVLTVTTATRSAGAQVWVKGQAAYLV